MNQIKWQNFLTTNKTFLNSHLAKLGFKSEFQDGFVSGKFVFKRKNPQLYSLTLPSTRTLHAISEKRNEQNSI